MQKDENGNITGVKATGKDYEISFEEIMDGEVQSDSSSESGSESGSSGQGTSAKVLQALENLTQKVDELNEKVGNTESSLEQLGSEFNDFKSNYSLSNGNIGCSEVFNKRMYKGDEWEIDVPENAIGIWCNQWPREPWGRIYGYVGKDKVWLFTFGTGGYNIFPIQSELNKIVITDDCESYADVRICFITRN